MNAPRPECETDERPLSVTLARKSPLPCPIRDSYNRFSLGRICSPFRLSTMPSGLPPCAYDAPMALDSTFSHTRGFDPLSAMSRNTQHLHNCIDHLLGPMPAQQFLDIFLPWDVPGGRRRRLQSRDAFKDVPLSWTRIDDMYTHLVSSRFLCLLSRHLIHTAPRSEQADTQTSSLSRLLLRHRCHTQSSSQQTGLHETSYLLLRIRQSGNRTQFRSFFSRRAGACRTIH